MNDLPDPEGEHAAAVRTVRLAAVAIVAVAIGALVVALTTLIVDDDGDRVGDEGSPAVDADDDGGGSGVAAVGPETGEQLAPYVQAARRRLADAEGERGAVISFTAYATEAAARRRATEAGLDVLGLLVALPGGQPHAVDDDLAGWLDEQAEAARTERTEIARLLPTVTDAEFAAFYEAELKRFDAIVAGAQPDGAIVFAIVVRGSADSLRTIATAAAVRFVDLAATSEVDPGAARGLRPESTVIAGEPDLRPHT